MLSVVQVCEKKNYSIDYCTTWVCEILTCYKFHHQLENRLLGSFSSSHLIVVLVDWEKEGVGVTLLYSINCSPEVPPVRSSLQIDYMTIVYIYIYIDVTCSSELSGSSSLSIVVLSN